MKFEVDPGLVQPIIRDQIAAAVVAQLGDPAELMRGMIALALRQKVSSDGKVSQYSSDNKYDFVEALAGVAIRKAASEAIQTIVSEQQGKIREAIEAELRKSPKKTAAAIVDAFVRNVNNSYSLKVDFNISCPER